MDRNNVTIGNDIKLEWLKIIRGSVLQFMFRCRQKWRWLIARRLRSSPLLFFRVSLKAGKGGNHNKAFLVLSFITGGEPTNYQRWILLFSFAIFFCFLFLLPTSKGTNERRDWRRPQTCKIRQAMFLLRRTHDIVRLDFSTEWRWNNGELLRSTIYP